MTLTTTSTLLGLGLAAGIGWFVGGTVGTGVFAGFLAGASTAGLCVLLQRKVAERKPEFLLQAVLACFLIKAFALLAATLAVQYVPALHAIADTLSFLIAFAVTAIGVIVPATIDLLRWVSARGAARASVATARPAAAQNLGAVQKLEESRAL